MSNLNLDLDARVAELREASFGCSQVVMTIGLERLKADAELISALVGSMEGYCGGSCGGTCGALCGGAGLMGFYLGKGTPDEPRSAALKGLVKTLTQEFSDKWGASTCDGIIHGEEAKHKAICPKLMADTIQRVWDILDANNIKLDERSAGQGI